jgi:hypothetical protein
MGVVVDNAGRMVCLDRPVAHSEFVLSACAPRTPG